MKSAELNQNLTHLGRSYDKFCTDLLVQDACCMCVIQIGELTGELSDEIKEANISVPSCNVVNTDFRKPCGR